MKRLFLVLLSVMLFVVPASAEMFVYDSGQDVTVSWNAVSDAFYYDVYLRDCTEEKSIPVSKTFDLQLVLTGLIKHNIYYLCGQAYDNEGQIIETMGSEYFCFAVDNSSSTCICNCPEIPKKVYYGTTGANWYTGIALTNSTPESQIALINIGNVTKAYSIPSYGGIAESLADILGIEHPEQAVLYPVTLDAVDGVGMTLCITDGISFGLQ